MNIPWKTWWSRENTRSASTERNNRRPPTPLEHSRRPAGYLHNQEGGPAGPRGIAYDYITAANGVLVQAANDRLQARIVVAEAPQAIKGLKPAAEFLHLVHGPIPGEIMAEALAWVGGRQHERFLYIKWEDGEYRLLKPRQEGTAGSVTYDRKSGALLEIHSHGRLRAFFSATDNRDEQGFSLYGVLGTGPGGDKELRLRVGIYGHFAPVELESIATPSKGKEQQWNTT